ncbi:hypothetical protein NPIL_616971 [Nephila pilipes]|uniref:Uncharacterized protein n=1 Tax=Nephila pilipes TaxID=299642 RepID=A0A8X6IB77_NEPPI|nr:hypothetical protein NPIL_616971 [Nephila pilipes]
MQFIRDMVNPYPIRCATNKITIFQYFNSIWAVENEATNNFPAPPDLPSVSEAIDVKLVQDCLRQTENTSPDPDIIGYKHWILRA